MARTIQGRKNRARHIRGNLASMPFDSQRVIETLGEADRDSHEEGVGWYHIAHSIGADLAKKYKVPTMQSIGVLAAFSPMTNWGENIRLAGEAFESFNSSGQVGGHTGNVCTKAVAILNGADPGDVLKGFKVRSFYLNMLRPDRPGPVTVDRHALDLLCNGRGANPKLLERAGVYSYAAGCFRAAAREMRILPHQAQAIAWVHWRKVHDVAYQVKGFAAGQAPLYKVGYTGTSEEGGA